MTVPTVDVIMEGPIAAQGTPPVSTLFAFDKWSSAPGLVDAIGEAAMNPDWQRRLFFVPRAHVTRLHVNNGVVKTIEVEVNGQHKFLTVSPKCAVVLANSTVEATRLALESFPTPLMGRNLMTHMRSNIVVRVKRSAFGAAAPQGLEAAALLVRGSTPKGRYHLQVTAAAIVGAEPEATMWRMIPDIDLIDLMLTSPEDWIVITLRGMGEMLGDRDANTPKVTDSAPSWIDLSDQTDEFGVRRAWVSVVPRQDDLELWEAMDTAALTLAKKLARNDPTLIEYFYGGAWRNTPPVFGMARDGLGTTHGEAGTLWMGADPNTSVTNLDGRFHHISNAYVGGPALFPTLGSANPALTGLALARRTVLAVARESLGAEPGFTPLGGGGLAGWQMAGNGGFIELGGNVIESVGGIGLLWFTKEQFDDFILRVDLRLNSATDRSGIFVRIPALGTGDPPNDWKPAVTQGYEIQIGNTGFNPDSKTFDHPLHKTGQTYMMASSNTVIPPMPHIGRWHTYEIEAVGQKITVRVNGAEVSRLTNANRSPKGYIGLQNYHAGSKVQFTRLQIKKLR
ncbi:MAG TPA: family 16 glycoside hydrolase [Terriglobales bacterium]|nr:family 16 glycoside hydrolase [Terriglobales bacterium]